MVAVADDDVADAHGDPDPPGTLDLSIHPGIAKTLDDLAPPSKDKQLKQFWDRPSRPCPGTAIITSKQLPEEYWGNFLNLNVISFQGIYRVKEVQEGSGLHGVVVHDGKLEGAADLRREGVALAP